MRIDKWLWAARFFKTRGLAQQAIGSGRVELNEARVKPAHELRLGDVVEIRIGEYGWKVFVKGLSDKRGPASAARLLYAEDEESRAAREKKIALRRYSAEPAAELKGRPTKRDRRRLEDLAGWPEEE